jgi:hypothetical protein
MKTETIKTASCINCSKKLMRVGVATENRDSIALLFCDAPECPNFGLFQVPAEHMSLMKDGAK